MKTVSYPLALLLLAAGSTTAAATPTDGVHHVPLFRAHELQVQNPFFQETLTTTGLLALSLAGSSTARDTALGGLCRCSTRLSELQGGDSVTLGDGQTIRSTLATATVGTSPLPLGDDLAQVCGAETAQAMETLRDQVAEASGLFLRALDRYLLASAFTGSILKNSYGGSYDTVSSVVAAASNLEHFHVYRKQENLLEELDTKPALQVHTDAGLFLAFVPAHGCSAKGEDESFYLKDAQGNLQRAVFPPNSVAIMLGAGAENWLQTSVPLKATRHSVRMESGVSRAWYGMMHLVPEAAIVEQGPIPKTFGEMRQAMVLKGHNKATRTFGDDPLNNEPLEDVSIGCGFSDLQEDYSNTDTATALVSSRRRRLQHVENAGACNNVTNFYCWMSCLDVPHADEAEELVEGGYSLYCLDPSVFAATSMVAEAQNPCISQGVVGLAMNSNCLGSWQPTAPGVEAADVIVESTAPEGYEFEEAWCYGGTSMYMDGFQWLGTTCAIYLFPSLVLNSVGALVGACIFTIFFGMSLEWVIQQRRITVQKFDAGYRRLAVSACFYGIQLSMGYTIMLVVMIYSIPLFISVVLGIVGGHICFSAPDAIFKSTAAAPADITTERSDKLSDCPEASCNGVDKEEPTRVMGYSSHTEHVPGFASTACSRRKKVQEPDLEVPEGSTPCCQNAL